MILSKYLPRDEELSLPELEKIGRAWVAALAIIPGHCMDDKGLSTTNMTLQALSLAKTGNSSMASLLLSHHCSSCESVSHSLHIVAI